MAPGVLPETRLLAGVACLPEACFIHASICRRVLSPTDKSVTFFLRLFSGDLDIAFCCGLEKTGQNLHGPEPKRQLASPGLVMTVVMTWGCLVEPEEKETLEV